MSFVTLSNLSLQYGNNIILDGVDLAIQSEGRIGLLGRNGAEKTTLLRLLTGSLAPDRGSIDIHRSIRVGLLDQHPNFPPEVTVREVARGAFTRLDELQMELKTVFADMGNAEGQSLERLFNRQTVLQEELESLGGWDVEHRVDATLHGVGLVDAIFDRQTQYLSGGERSRLALARLLLEAPDLLLLDEPTNHLDIEGCQWLEQFLNETYRGATIVVSHDRWLLDAVCTRIVEVRRGKIDSYPGNYSDYVGLRAQRRTTESRAWQKQQDHIRREQAYIRRYKAGQRAKQAKGRESRLERFIDEADIERPEAEVVASMQLPSITRCGDRVLSAECLSVEVGDLGLVQDLDLEIRRGDRIGIIGPNGAGKTTLIRCLLGEIEPASGVVEIGTGVDVGWFLQHQDHLDPQWCVWEWIRQTLAKARGEEVSEQTARNLAGAFLFSGEDQDRLLGTLSGGERARVTLAGLFGGGHNVLVLDEPTNHVDIATSERLESVLSQGGPFQGTLILVSHDRALLEATCARLIVFEGDGSVCLFDGVLSRWLEKKRTSSSSVERDEEPLRLAPVKNAHSPLDGLSVETLERRMETMELRLEELRNSMNDQAIWSDSDELQRVLDEQKDVAAELAEHEEAWLERHGDSPAS